MNGGFELIAERFIRKKPPNESAPIRSDWIPDWMSFIPHQEMNQA